jgi:hypothetical protein
MRKTLFSCLLSAGIFLLVGILPVWSADIPYDYNYGLGPLNLRSSSTGQSLRLSLPSIVPGTIRPGWGVRVNASTSNVWLNEQDYLFDYEVFDGGLAVSYGLTERLGFLLGFDQRVYYGGILDGFLEGFHDLFGFDQDGRDKWPQNETWIIRKDLGTSTQDVDEINNNGLNGVISYNLTQGRDKWIPAVSLSGIIRYGLEGPESPDEPLDLGISLGLAKRLGKRWYTYGHVGYTRFGVNTYDNLALEFTDNILSATAAVSWHVKPNIPIILQYQYTEGAIKNLGEFGDPEHLLNAGFKWEMKHGGVFEFGLMENFINLGNSNDFGLMVGYSYNFKQKESQKK